MFRYLLTSIAWCSALLLVPGTVAGQETELNFRKKFRELEMTLPSGRKTTVRAREASYLLGKQLALRSVLQLKRFPESELDTLNQKIDRLASGLGVDIGGLERMEGFDKYWDARKALLGNNPQSIAGQLGQRQSTDFEGLFRLGCELTFASSIYDDAEGSDESVSAQQRELNRLMNYQLQSALIQADFDDIPTAVRSIDIAVDWIDNEYPAGPPFARVVRECFEDVEDLLEREKTSSPELKNIFELRHELRYRLEKFVAAEGTKKIRLFREWTPTLEASQKLFKSDFAKSAAAHYEQLFNDPEMALEPEPSQTGILIDYLTSDDIVDGAERLLEFPGGYRSLGPYLNRGHIIFSVRFVEPGKETGYRVEGFVKIEGRWYCFPKAWRVLKR